MSRSVHPGPVHVSGVEAACRLLWGAWTGDPQGRLPYSKHTGAGRWDAGLHPSAPPPPTSAPAAQPGEQSASTRRPYGGHSAGSMRGPQLQAPLRMPCCRVARPTPPQPRPPEVSLSGSPAGRHTTRALLSRTLACSKLGIFLRQ